MAEVSWVLLENISTISWILKGKPEKLFYTTWNFCAILWPKASWIWDQSRHTKNGRVQKDIKEPGCLMGILNHLINQLYTCLTSGYLLSIIIKILILKLVRVYGHLHIIYKCSWKHACPFLLGVIESEQRSLLIPKKWLTFHSPLHSLVGMISSITFPMGIHHCRNCFKTN